MKIKPNLIFYLPMFNQPPSMSILGQTLNSNRMCMTMLVLSFCHIPSTLWVFENEVIRQPVSSVG